MTFSSQPSRRTLRGVLALAAVPLLLLTSSCSIFSDGTPVRDDGEQGVTESGRADVDKIIVGDCLDSTTNSTVSQVPIVPCAEEHDEEVFGSFTLPPGEFPAAETLESEGWEQCDALFAEYIGLPYEESALEYYTLSPTQDSWESRNDRVVSCIVSDPAGPMTGSLKGAAR